jgi:uncharacterized LabA/DUF88 family protein
LPLVEEVKRLGKRVEVWFFEQAPVSPALKLSSDSFTDISRWFTETWDGAQTKDTL